MARKLYEESYIIDIAEAIRNKGKTTTPYKTSEMAEAINNLSVSDDGSLEEVIDEIRKGNGQTGEVTLEDMPLAVSEIDNSHYGKIPSYWKNAISTAKTTIKNLVAANSDNIPCFAYASDLHYNATQSPNRGYTGVLMADVMNACEIPFAMIDGDTARSDGNGLSNEEQMKECFIVANNRLAPIGWHRLLETKGNHDGSWGYNADYSDPYYCYQMTEEEIYKYKFDKLARTSNHIFGGAGKSYYYVDDNTNKIRYIMLDSLWIKDEEDENGVAVNRRMRTYGFGQDQLSWLVNTALSFEESGWGVIFGTHVPPTSAYASTYRDEEVLKNILQCYKDGTSGTYTYGTSGSWKYVSVTVDFSAYNRAEMIGLFCGHCHKDSIDLDTFPCPIITITSDADLSYDDAEENRIAGTDNEHAIDFVTVNRTKQEVVLTRLGVGVSRAYSYKGTVLYSITNSLSNVTNSNGVASIEEGTSYSATLSAISGYEMKSVRVTMGGADITSTAVSGNTITIANVTGDIVITATATVKPNYTNQIPISIDTDGNVYNGTGYKDNTRFNSSQDEKEQAGWFVTGYIPITQGDVVRFKNLIFSPTTNASYNYFIFYDSDFTKKYTCGGANYANINGVLDDSGNVVQITPDMAVETYGTIAYMRMSAKGTGAEAIVTVNEEIAV